MRAWIHALALWIQALALGGVLLSPAAARAAVETGKVLMVVEHQLTVAGPKPNEVHRFDIRAASIYRDGLPAPAGALVGGDWVTVTTEKQQDGRVRVTLVEASSDR